MDTTTTTTVMMDTCDEENDAAPLSSLSPLQQESVDRVSITMSNVMPTNLRDPACSFLTSRVSFVTSFGRLVDFCRCYGYMLFDRDEKLNCLKNVSDSQSQVILAALNECRDVDTFKELLAQQLQKLDRIVAGEQYLVDNDTSSSSLPTATAASENEHYRGLLDTARDSLRKILQYLREDDKFTRSVAANDVCRIFTVNNAMNTLRRNLVDWLELNAMERSQVATTENSVCNNLISVLFRDLVVGTAVETHVTFVFMIRASLLISFLVENIMLNDSVNVALTASEEEVSRLLEAERRLTESIDNETTGTEERAYNTLLRDVVRYTRETSEQQQQQQPTDGQPVMRQHYEVVSSDHFVATVLMATVRCYFANFANWPYRVARNIKQSSSFDVNKMRDIIFYDLAKYRNYDNNNCGWLRLIARNNGQSRLYVNNESLWSMFEQLALCGPSATSAASSSSTTTTTTTDTVIPLKRSKMEGGFSGRAINLIANNDSVNGSTLKLTSATLRNKWLDFQNKMRIVGCAFIRATNDELANLLLRYTAYDRISPGMDERAMADVVYEDIRDDLYNFTFSAINTLRHDVVNDVEGGDDDDDDDLFSSRYNGRMWIDDDKRVRSRIAREVAVLHLTYRLINDRSAICRADNILSYLTMIWNDYIGISSMEQISQILAKVYELFPISTKV